MRALGFTAWARQTVTRVERVKRRLTAEEILGLALALETTPAALMRPTGDDGSLIRVDGLGLPAVSVILRVAGVNDGALTWDGDRPVVGPGRPVPVRDYLAKVGLEALEGLDIADTSEGVSDSAQQQSGESQPVVAAIVTSAKGVLIGRRNDRTPPWTFIAGEQEPGEQPEDTIIREVKEETGLEVRAGEVIGERDHPDTGRHMVYLAARPVRSTRIIVGDEAELSEVRWASLAEAEELLPGMFGPVRDYLARTLKGGAR